VGHPPAQTERQTQHHALRIPDNARTPAKTLRDWDDSAKTLRDWDDYAKTLRDWDDYATHHMQQATQRSLHH
jgi:hypothetical protein